MKLIILPPSEFSAISRYKIYQDKDDNLRINVLKYSKNDLVSQKSQAV